MITREQLEMTALAAGAIWRKPCPGTPAKPSTFSMKGGS